MNDFPHAKAQRNRRDRKGEDSQRSNLPKIVMEVGRHYASGGRHVGCLDAAGRVLWLVAGVVRGRAAIRVQVDEVV